MAADAKNIPLESSRYEVLCDAGALHVDTPTDVPSILRGYRRVLSKKGVLFIGVFNKTVNDSDDPIFYVDSPNNTMSVYGYSKEQFIYIVNNYFFVEKAIYDLNDGLQEQGCNYLYWGHHL